MVGSSGPSPAPRFAHCPAPAARPAAQGGTTAAAAVRAAVGQTPRTRSLVAGLNCYCCTRRDASWRGRNSGKQNAAACGLLGLSQTSGGLREEEEESRRKGGEGISADEQKQL